MSIAATLDPTDAAILAAVRSRTMVGADRLAAVVDAARYVVRHGIPGALVECGVWRGGCAMAMAMAVIDESEHVGVQLDRDLWLYDTFTGMTAPTEVDITHTGMTAEAVLARFAPAPLPSASPCSASTPTGTHRRGTSWSICSLGWCPEGS